MSRPEFISEQEAAELGIFLDADDRAAIAAAQQAERARLRSLNAETGAAASNLVAVFNRSYPKFLQFLVGVGEIVLTFSQTVIVAFGVPSVLVLLMVVEQQRVWHGIALFETDSALASFAAWALVLLNLTLEFTIEHVEHKAAFQTAPPTRLGLRTWLVNAAYVAGVGGPDWRPQALSPAQRYRRLLRLVTFSILALALAGSMRTVIAGQDGAWYAALGAIVRDSSLASMTTWIGGLLFAVAAVLSAQGLSRYVAIRCVEILTAMTARAEADTRANAQEFDNVTLAYLAAKVAQKQGADAKRERVRTERLRQRQNRHTGDADLQSMAPAGAETFPFLPARPSSNGKHEGIA